MQEAVRETEQFECLQHYVGAICSGIAFGAMSNCGEQYLLAEFAGYHEVTWGVVLKFGSRGQLVLTWDEDSRVGDPFFVNCIDSEKFMRIDSVEMQDVSGTHPWDQYVATTLCQFAVLTYQTNYPGRSETTWRNVPWAIELQFDGGPLLIGAMRHGDFLNYTISADEIVVVQDPAIIEKAKESRANLRSGWTESAL